MNILLVGERYSANLGDAVICETVEKIIEEKYNGNIVILELKELEISSTDIRERIRDNKRIDFFVPPKVREFIESKHLYKED